MLGTSGGAGTGLYQVTTTAGKKCVFKKWNANKWKYTVDGKDVVSGECTYKDSKKTITITTLDASAVDLETMLLMSQVYGAFAVHKRNGKPAVIGFLVVMTLLRVASAQ